MTGENIEKVANEEPKLFKRVYFIKPSLGEPDFELDEDREKPKDAQVVYDSPPQIRLDYEGTVRVTADDPQTMLGLIDQLRGQEKWKELMDETERYSDSQFDGLSVKIGEHYFYVTDFDSREDLIGVIKEKFQSWQTHLSWLEDKLTGEMQNEGDDQLKDKVKVNKGGL